MFDGKHQQIGIIDYKVGDKVSEYYHSHGVVSSEAKPTSGVVTYVHPCGRFYEVEFTFGNRKARECYTVRSDINPVIRYGWF